VRLPDEQMNVLRHQNITSNHKAISLTHHLKFTLEDSVRRSVAQQRLPAITTEGEKVKDSAVLITNKSIRHDKRIRLPIR
jgi:hypothetical protein